jgi:drug/metabolite transporter (DMT)-like permease
MCALHMGGSSLSPGVPPEPVRTAISQRGRNVKLTTMNSLARNARSDVRKGSLYGLGAAVLFGASTPLSKLLLPHVSPLMLAALLYLGAAGLLPIFRGLAVVRVLQSSEAKIRSSDARTLCAVVVFGGVLGPVLMLFGLTRISALTGSLLLNL